MSFYFESNIFDYRDGIKYKYINQSSRKFLEKSFDKNYYDIPLINKKLLSNDYDYEDEKNLDFSKFPLNFSLNDCNDETFFEPSDYPQKKFSPTLIPDSIENTITKDQTKDSQNPAIVIKIIEIPQVKETEKKNKPPKKLIFGIRRVNKNVGRIKKEQKALFSGEHDQFGDDNINQKIKVSLQESIRKYINGEYENFYRNDIEKTKEKFIKKINSQKYKSIKKDDNLQWFALQLKNLFSAEISPKYSKFEKNYNKRQIEKLYKENRAKNVIGILDKICCVVINRRR